MARTLVGAAVTYFIVNTGLVAVAGAVLVWAGSLSSLSGAVGLGILTYAGAILLYTLLGARRLWRRSQPEA